jgi:acetolactate synthase small subunit
VEALINKREYDKLVCCAVKHSGMSEMECAVAVGAKNVHRYRNVRYKLLNCIADISYTVTNSVS